MAKSSAGLLMYRQRGGLEVLLVHPGGPFWKSKDDGAWTIPKGEFSADELPLDAALREFREETGLEARGPFTELGPVKQKGGKVVYCWAFEGDCDPAAIRSNTFTMEWPPKSGKQAEFPEIDRAAWFTPAEARKKILPALTALIEQLEQALA
jgi:predicted NUDIX family NTP pyrophosphohydrolase